MVQAVKFLKGNEVGGNVFADGGMRTTAGFDGADAMGGQSLVSDGDSARPPG